MRWIVSCYSPFHPKLHLRETQKQEQTQQDPRLAVIGGTNDNIGQKPGQVVVKGDGENPEEASKNSGSDWLISIKEKLKQAVVDDAASSCSKPCIYKVPRSLRSGDDKAFVPLTVSLGPYHHGDEHLRQMEHHKWRFLRRVLDRTNQDITVYLNSVGEVEEKARSCYEGPIHFSSNEFVEMMVLDGCFVLELFRAVDVGFVTLGYPTNDPIFARPTSMSSIQRDMIMLENQLPLFVLDRLLKIQLGCHDLHKDVTKLAVNFLMSNYQTFLGKKAFDLPSDAGLHCLEILWRILLDGSKPNLQSNNSYIADKVQLQLQVIHCATELKDSGIKFKKSNADRFWDIEFKNGVLWIPHLSIDGSIKSFFLNLIAFEQCHFGCGNHITSYVLFMDNLINSPMDVAHLHSCGIIEHWLGSDSEVADLFNRLGHGVVIDIRGNYLSQLSAEVNKHHNRRWNTWKAILKNKHLNNPWAIISVIAGVVLLLLTFTQTFYGVYAYYRPSS